MDGENEKGKREGARGERGKLMIICASNQVSTLSLSKALFTINPGFQPTKHEPLCLTQSKHNGSVVSCGNLFLSFSVILKNDLSHKATKPLRAQATMKLGTHALSAQRTKLCDRCRRSGSSVGMK